MTLVGKGYVAVNSGHFGTLRAIPSHDAVQHVVGNSQIAGAYEGIDAVLDYSRRSRK